MAQTLCKREVPQRPSSANLQRRKRAGRGAIERLEMKRFLSFSLDGGILAVQGTPESDEISVSMNGTTLVLADSGTMEEYAAGVVAAIVIDGADGDDTVSLAGDVTIASSINGGNGNDQLRGGAAPDTVSGGPGNDLIDGGDGNDALSGNGGSNSIFGGAGDDRLNGSGGRDSLLGQDGNDRIYGNGSADHINGGAGDDHEDGGDGDDLIEDLFGDNLLIGCKGNDILSTGPGNDLIAGFQGDDLIHAGDGNDTLDGGQGADTLDGESGANVYINNNGSARLVGDTYTSGTDKDTIIPNGKGSFVQSDAADSVTDLTTTSPFFYDGIHSLPAFQKSSGLAALPEVNAGVLRIAGTTRSDAISVNQRTGTISVTVNGSVTNFVESSVSSIEIECGGGDDTVLLQTSRGTNFCLIGANIIGGNGDDVLIGGMGDDSISGGKGNDLLDGGGTETSAGDGADDLSGGAGTDRALYVRRTQSLSINFADNLANDGATGEQDNVHSDIEDLASGSGSDVITGNDRANLIAAGLGDDSVDAAMGNDLLIGGDGTDTLNGGSGTDVFFVDDGSRDDFDVKLFNSGYPRGDFVFGDPFLDFSRTSGRHFVVPKVFPMAWQ